MFSRLASTTTRIWTVRLLLVATAIWASGHLGIWAVELMRPQAIPVAEVPPLQVHPEALDFGEVVESNSFRHEVPVRNISSKAMTVRFANHCDCAGIEPKELRLEPGETGRVVLILDLMHNRARYAGRTIRPFAAHFDAIWGDRAGDQLDMAADTRSR